MSLSTGSRLGPYEILSALGAGGMGEVYKARDTRLDRTVAIKVLTDTLAADPQFRNRFDREARAISQLMHPHICTVYDVGEQQGTAYLVMEYLEGETLADWLKKGALPLEHALQYAIQIASALDTAHRAGITHRDLKPGNVMLTKAGAKLLDFGLAKTGAPALVGAGVSMRPTTPANLTAQGTILGTFQYMAPEQIEGQEADARTDLFAFGAVLYEMITGKKAFEGKSHASLIGAIMHSEPPAISTIEPLMPPLLDHIVTRCLAKDPDERWQSAKDLHDELIWIAEPRSDPATSSRALSGGRANRLTWVLMTVATIVAAAMTGIAGWKLKPEPPRAVRRFAIVLPEGSQFPPFGNILAVSPDATHLVYNAGATSAVGNLLYLRAMDQLAATPIQGVAAGATGNSFFSPDGQWIGFWQNGRLKKVAVTGGAPLDLCDVPALFGASWTSDGTILFGRGPDGIWQVSAGGGQPSQRITVDAKKEIAFGPQMLPGGKAVLFTLAPQQVGASNQALWDNAEIVVQSLDSGKRTVVVRGGADARYVPTGHIVYVRQGTLLALPFDPARNAAIGNPVSVVDGIRQEATAAGGIGFGGTTGAAQFTVSENGLFAYVPQDTAASVARTLVWVDRHGRETALPVPDRAYVYPRISPDGTRIALDIRDQQQDIWTWDLSREILNRVTFDPAVDNNPLWTPDGRRIVFSRQGQGIFARAADGTGAEERLTESGSNPHWPNAFSRDGTRLVFSDVTAQRSHLKMLSLDDQRTVDLIARPIVGETNAEISPDGRWLAYQSNESGQLEIYVRPFPNVQGGRWQVSRAGGTRPLWARSGRELFYFAYSASGGTVMAVPVESSSGFQAGNPSKLFAGPYYAALSGRTYDVSPDGQRFLMIRAAASAVNNTPRIIVVENWFEELKRLVPTTH